MKDVNRLYPVSALHRLLLHATHVAGVLCRQNLAELLLNELLKQFVCLEFAHLKIRRMHVLCVLRNRSSECRRSRPQRRPACAKRCRM